MPAITTYVIGLLLGYLFGSFPTGYFAGKLWNVDVRKHGSGRTGGTNVLRTAGWGAFTITVIGDVLKGVIPVLLARWLFPEFHGAHGFALLGVLLGHNWSVFIALLAKDDPHAAYAPPPIGWIQQIKEKGRGGAGVATTAGAGLALFAPAALLLAPIGIGILIIVRYASVASLTVAALYPIVMLAFAMLGQVPWSYVLIAVVAAFIIIAVHKPNIDRLRTGTERRFGQRLGRENHG
jgi:glycerol-3-phosphate acyltransferase PlsY